MQSSTVLRATFADPANAIALIEEYYEAVQVVARDSREAMLQYLSDPQSAVWVAYRDSIPAGCILYRPLPQIASAGEVKRLYVRPEFRGHGLNDPAPDWVNSFADWFHDELTGNRIDHLLDYRRQAPFAAKNHPTEEHLLPLYTALGAAGEKTDTARLHASATYSVLRMDVYAFSDAQ